MALEDIAKPPAHLAATDSDAASRYASHKGRDPFPDIPCALLNSADIIDYVAATGMLHPFTQSSDKLKPASYEVDFLGEVQHWDAKREEWVKTEIKRGQPFVLKSNSIAFVQVEPYFRLPDYIAIRFNLRITHVYRGILLGTGPLVDPGFQGKLYIPLHNLTSNDYTFLGGEGLIWMEFTKLSWPPPPGNGATGSLPHRYGTFGAFPLEKTEKPLDYYLHKAYPHGRIRSSIPVEIATARKAATQAKRQITRLRNFGLLTIIGLVLTIVFQLGTVFTNMTTLADRVEARIDERLRDLQRQLDELASRISRTEAEEVPVHADLDDLTAADPAAIDDSLQLDQVPRMTDR